jgi:hypothetical protein
MRATDPSAHYSSAGSRRSAVSSNPAGLGVIDQPQHVAANGTGALAHIAEGDGGESFVAERHCGVKRSEFLRPAVSLNVDILRSS